MNLAALSFRSADRALLAGRRAVASDFGPEWCAIALFLLIDIAWALEHHVAFTVRWADGVLIGMAALVMLVTRGFAAERGGMIAEYFGLTVAASGVGAIFSYLCQAHSMPLIDTELQRLDAAMGFDWQASFRALMQHPLGVAVLQQLYDSLFLQGLYFCLLMGLLNRKAEMREMFWLALIAGILTSLVSWMLPSAGPYAVYHHGDRASFVATMAKLRSGHDLTFALSETTGVVNFPSFHAVMALAYMWGFRRTGLVGWVMVAVNAGVLISIPSMGGHYAIDMIGGAVVMLVSLAIVRSGPALLLRHWPQKRMSAA